jgi:hypothetical protein
MTAPTALNAKTVPPTAPTAMKSVSLRVSRPKHASAMLSSTPPNRSPNRKASRKEEGSSMVDSRHSRRLGPAFRTGLRNGGPRSVKRWP